MQLFVLFFVESSPTFSFHDVDQIFNSAVPHASTHTHSFSFCIPHNATEKKHGTLPVVTASTGDKTVTVIKGKGARQVRQQFSFDNVFTSFSTQEEVFDETLKPVIR